MVDLKSNIRLFIRFFSCFGLVQVRYGSDGQLEVLRNSKFIIPVLLLIYWINAVAIFFFERISTDKISTVSNGIQLILNCIMISVLMVVPIKYAQLASRSIAKIQDLDAEFEKAGIVVDYKKLQRKFWGIISFFVMFLTYVVSYDGFVTYKNGFTSFKYWFVTILPSFFMVLILSQAICAVALVSSFYKTVNKAIVQQIRYEKDVPKFNSNSDKLKGRVSLTVSGHNQAPFFPKVFYILGDLHEICLKLENYFGPVFLVTFTTIFVVTSIQLYYCYQIFQIQDEERGFSYWSLAQCLNVVATNIILVVTVTALCQTITNQASDCVGGNGNEPLIDFAVFSVEEGRSLHIQTADCWVEALDCEGDSNDAARGAVPQQLIGGALFCDELLQFGLQHALWRK